MLRHAARVASVSGEPPGYLMAECSECGVPVWVHEKWDGVAADLGFEEVVICPSCFERVVSAGTRSTSGLVPTPAGRG
jgi:hypothetical protein